MRHDPVCEAPVTCENEWTVSRLQPVLSGDEVHVWRCSLQPSIETVRSLSGILSNEEKRRADRFVCEQHRRRYTVAQGVCRVILGRYLDLSPDRLQFSKNRYGKPALEGRWAHDLRFNLSFSSEMAVLAVALGREVGIDVEHIRPFPGSDQIVRRYFSNRENEEYFSLHGNARQRAFFTSWVRKEAYIKARGKGLSLPLNAFSVSLHPEGPVTLVHHGDQEYSDSSWCLKDVWPIDGYAAAVVVERGQRLRFSYQAV